MGNGCQAQPGSGAMGSSSQSEKKRASEGGNPIASPIADWKRGANPASAPLLPWRRANVELSKLSHYQWYVTRGTILNVCTTHPSLPLDSQFSPSRCSAGE